MEIKCNCGKTLFIIDRDYKGGIAVKNILVEEHECLIPSWTFKQNWGENIEQDYYADEGKQLEHNDTDQIIYSNIILYSLYPMALIRCTMRTYR